MLSCAILDIVVMPLKHKKEPLSPTLAQDEHLTVEGNRNGELLEGLDRDDAGLWGSAEQVKEETGKSEMVCSKWLP